MAKVRFNDQAAASQLLRSLGKVRDSKRMNEEIGEFVVGEIKSAARRGKPLNNSRKFKSPLELSTIDARKRLAKFNRTHPDFRPSKANLTFTGQLIDAVSFELRGSELQIEVDDTPRKPIRTGPRSRQKNAPTNAELQEFLLDISPQNRIFTRKGLLSDPKILKRVKRILLKFTKSALDKL